MVSDSSTRDDARSNCDDLFFSSLGEAEEGLDGFEVDGFIVDNVEDEEDGEEENPKQTQKKKKKLLYFPAL